jgi:hypothetical protein
LNVINLVVILGLKEQELMTRTLVSKTSLCLVEVPDRVFQALNMIGR